MNLIFNYKQGFFEKLGAKKTSLILLLKLITLMFIFINLAYILNFLCKIPFSSAL
jgi:hypothetical protein